MGKEDISETVERWRNPNIKRQEESIELVVRVLEGLGFEVRLGAKNHYVASYPQLSGAPFGLRCLTISAHAHGKAGIVPKTAINKIVEAIERIEEIQQEDNEKY